MPSFRFINTTCHHPNQSFLNKTRPPLIGTAPVMFWRRFPSLLLIAVIVLAGVKTLR